MTTAKLGLRGGRWRCERREGHGEANLASRRRREVMGWGLDGASFSLLHDDGEGRWGWGLDGEGADVVDGSCSLLDGEGELLRGSYSWTARGWRCSGEGVTESWRSTGAPSWIARRGLLCAVGKTEWGRQPARATHVSGWSNILWRIP